MVRRQFHFLGDRDCRPDGQLVREAVRDISRPEAAAPSVATVPRSSAVGSSSNESSAAVSPGAPNTIVWILADGKRRERQISTPP